MNSHCLRLTRDASGEDNPLKSIASSLLNAEADAEAERIHAQLPPDI